MPKPETSNRQYENHDENMEFMKIRGETVEGIRVGTNQPITHLNPTVTTPHAAGRMQGTDTQDTGSYQVHDWQGFGGWVKSNEAARCAALDDIYYQVHDSVMSPDPRRRSSRQHEHPSSDTRTVAHNTTTRPTTEI